MSTLPYGPHQLITVNTNNIPDPPYHHPTKIGLGNILKGLLVV